MHGLMREDWHSQPWYGYLGTVRRKGRKQISQPKVDNASSLLYPQFGNAEGLLHFSCHFCKELAFGDSD